SELVKWSKNDEGGSLSLTAITVQATRYQPCRSGAWALCLNTKSGFNSGFDINASQKRWASHATTKEDDGKISIGPRRGGEVGEDGKDSGVVYYGPISSTIKKVKLLSLSTCCLSVSLGQ
ncbi:hypothetical protein Prudu_007096, partial [Prunus dulcis]